MKSKLTQVNCTWLRGLRKLQAYLSLFLVQSSHTLLLLYCRQKSTAALGKGKNLRKKEKKKKANANKDILFSKKKKKKCQ